MNCSSVSMTGSGRMSGCWRLPGHSSQFAQPSVLMQVICTKVRDGAKRIVRLKEGEPKVGAAGPWLLDHQHIPSLLHRVILPGAIDMRAWLWSRGGMWSSWTTWCSQAAPSLSAKSCSQPR